ncbi:MAG: diguanylate cyclase [Desulfatibacillum sp.]|nr:diguanylate cyclase [Desulfatibacillum sp.]
MAGAYQTASHTPAQMHKIIILAKNHNLGESLVRMLERSTVVECSGLTGTPEEAGVLFARYPSRAILLDHPPSSEEKILARIHSIPLALLDDDTTQNQPEPGVCSRMHKNQANTISLELLFAHAMEKHSLIMDMERSHAQFNLYREDREMARRLGHIISMIGVEAHEVNQPLTSLLGHIELVNMNRGDLEKILRYIERVDESGDKIANIIKKLQDLRHDYWVCDSPFENDARSLNILFAGTDSRKLVHLSKVLEPYDKISLARALEKSIPPETDLVLAEFSPEHDWEAWVNNAKQEEKTVVLVAELGRLPMAYRIVNDVRVDGVIPAWASDSECLQGLTQACEVAYFRDKAENSQKQLKQVALKDDLTNLVTNLIINRAIEKEIPRSEKMNRTSCISVVYLENGNYIQEKFGAKALNQAISLLGKQLRKQASREDLPSRIQGNQFTVLLPGRNKAQAVEWCRAVSDCLEQNPFDWFGKTISLIISAGISEHTGGAPETSKEWMERATKAINDARTQGPGSIAVR